MSVTNKEKNFISAVVYLHNDGAQAVRFFKALNAVLDQHFEQYELVAVDDACADDTICPRSTAGSSKMFYRVFNGNSHSAYKLRTDAFRLVSRRAINRVHASSETLPYRKAAYAASGLKMTDLEFDGRLTDNSGGRFALAMDSLALYTDAGYKLSAGIAIVMMFLALAELAYTLIIFCAGHPIEGWTTMMFVLTLGFAGLFAVLTIIIKYLSLLVDLVFKKQNYLIESIEKIQK